MKNLHFRRYEYLAKKYNLDEKNVSVKLKKIFEPIAWRISRDVQHGNSDNNYVRDENGEALKKALDELKRCGISGLDSVKRDVQKYCWYIDVSYWKVKKFQKILNELKYISASEISGVYDKVTHKAWGKLLKDLENGDFVTFSNAVVDNANVTKDMMHTFDQARKVPIIIKNGGDVVKEAIDNLKNPAKRIEIANKRLLLSGALLDVVELGVEIDNDIKDGNGKMEKNTLITGLKIVGSWGGYFFGSYVGGAAATAIIVATGPVGVLGATLVGMAITIAFTAEGEELGEWFGETYGDRMCKTFNEGLVYSSNSPEYRAERAR